MKLRTDRWPSAWMLELTCGGQTSKVRINNVSETGFSYVGSVFGEVGDDITFVAMTQTITARIVRLSEDRGAVTFHRPISQAQLANLRQIRELY